MPKDDLWRLRLKYEHSVMRCALCARRGTVGEDIKLYLASSEKQDAPHMVFRCADRETCRRRA